MSDSNTAINLWSVERLNEHSAFLLHLGYRMFATTPARAFGIAAALNTPEGYAAFTAARDAHNAGEYGSPCPECNGRKVITDPWTQAEDRCPTCTDSGSNRAGDAR